MNNPLHNRPFALKISDSVTPATEFDSYYQDATLAWCCLGCAIVQKVKTVIISNNLLTSHIPYDLARNAQTAAILCCPTSILEAMKNLWVVSVQHESIRTSNCLLIAAINR